MFRRFLIYHAWLPQVPEGTGAEELPGLFRSDRPDVGAISRVSLDCSSPLPNEYVDLACRGRLFEVGLGPEDALTCIEELV